MPRRDDVHRTDLFGGAEDAFGGVRDETLEDFSDGPGNGGRWLFLREFFLREFFRG
jgi:hypothetical protein